MMKIHVIHLAELSSCAAYVSLIPSYGMHMSVMLSTTKPIDALLMSGPFISTASDAR